MVYFVGLDGAMAAGARKWNACFDSRARWRRERCCIIRFDPRGQGKPLSCLPRLWLLSIRNELGWQSAIIRRKFANRRTDQGSTRHESFLESRDAITRFLFPEDKPSPVDLCFVLGCLTPCNMDSAIELYEKGYTQSILISGHGRAPDELPEYEQFWCYALERKVPASAILVECKATNTLENFVFSKPIIEAEFGWQRIRRVALVTKPFHMRRAVMTARAQWPDHVDFIKLPSRDPGDPPAATWWETEAGRTFVLSELRAIGTYGLSGDLSGF